MYAIVETGGKQYRVEKGDVITVERMSYAEGEKVVLDKVLLYGSGKTVKIGSPYVKGASVNAEVVENGKGEKIIIFKYKAKKNYRKKQGHRQPFTMLKVSSISMEEKAEPAKKAAPAKKAEPAKKAAPAKKAEPAKKAAPAKKAEPAKKAAPAKKAEPAKKAAPAKKAEPAKKAAPAKKEDNQEEV